MALHALKKWVMGEDVFTPPIRPHVYTTLTMKRRLKIHQKSCTSESPAKAVGAARLSSSTPATLSATAAARPRVRSAISKTLQATISV